MHRPPLRCSAPRRRPPDRQANRAGAPKPPHSQTPTRSAAVVLAAALLAAGCAHRKPAPPSPTADPTGGIRFESVAASAGLTYRWPRQRRPLRILDAFGTGCAFLDFNRDGRPDILLVAEPHPILYLNRGGGTFEDVTARSGLAARAGAWKGCAVGDVDGDGWLDLLVNGYRCLALWHNRGGRGFTDVTRAAGLDPTNRGHWGCGGGFMDLNGDGRPELVLLNYVKFGPRERQLCTISGVPTGCPPRQYAPEFPELWRNLGGGRLQDVSVAAGMREATGTTQSLVFADLDDDGKQDFYIGNDGAPADLMHNRGGLHFENTATAAGLAYGLDGTALSAMGADLDDYDRDGRADLAVSGFSNEAYALFHALPGGLFEQTAGSTGLAGPTLLPLGFGAKWLDADNDRWPDLSFANGHVMEQTARIYPHTTFRQPLMLFRNLQGRGFQDIAPLLGGAFTTPLLGRGSATGDYDNDGRLDLLVVDYEGAPVLLHNVSRTANHWLTLDLRGQAPNPYAYGARITGTVGDRVWVAEVSPASSYLSSSDPRLHLGLGDATALDSLTIRWPSGRTRVLTHVAGDRVLEVRE